MFRKALLGIAVACAAMLGGCAGIGGTTTPVTVQSVEDATVLACGFLPLAASVTALLPTPAAIAAGTAEAIAALICKAVAPVNPTTGVRHRGVAAAPSIDGVVIHGTFIR